MTTGGPRYLCRLCERLLETREALVEHYQTVHQLQGRLPHRRPRRGSGQHGARRFGQQRGNGQVVKN